MDPNQPQDQFQDQSQPVASPKQQVVERVRSATNVLVTVRTNPTVDELAAAIGLTLMLNKLGKHATAVFSGEVPSTLEFLKPDETIETNTDSLRDFIVSLDKSKADKLRYKVEENVVKIFITPYRTSITQADLEFTQGDFNVDAVLALGVTQREELDQAITAHGRILHDATVVTITAGQRESALGAINWQDAGASSLSEMLVSISEAFQGGLIDPQIATSFLTGIVAETERFSNPKTTPKVMTMAAQLMAAGANQQLIANELDKAVEVDMHPPEPQAPLEGQPAEIQVGSDGSLSIAHDEPDIAGQKPDESGAQAPPLPSIDELLDEAAQKQAEATPVQAPPVESFLPPSDPGDEAFNPLMPASQDQPPIASPQPEMPEMRPAESALTTDKPPEAALQALFQPDPPQAEQPDTDEIGQQGAPIVVHPTTKDEQIHIDDQGNMMRKTEAPKHNVLQPLTEEQKAHPEEPKVEEPSKLPPPPEMPPDEAPDILPDNTTLSQLEESVNSPHLESHEGVDPAESARNAVQNALAQVNFDPGHNPRTDTNAMPLSNGNPNDHSVLPPVPGAEAHQDGPTAPPVPPPLQFPQ